MGSGEQSTDFSAKSSINRQGLSIGELKRNRRKATSAKTNGPDRLIFCRGAEPRSETRRRVALLSLEAKRHQDRHGPAP